MDIGWLLQFITMSQDISNHLRRMLVMLQAMPSGSYPALAIDFIRTTLCSTVEELHRLSPHDVITAYSHTLIYNLAYLESKKRELDFTPKISLSIPELVLIHETLITTIEAALTRGAPSYS